MQVLVRIEGHIREFFPRYARGAAVTVAEPATVTDVLKAAGIPPELPNAVLLGGVRVEFDRPVAGGDELVLLSPLAGG